jgi:hypothetical protein
MWKCEGTVEINPVSKLITKVFKGIGLPLDEYIVPSITIEDTLDTYLSKYDKAKWEIRKDLQPRLGDTIIVSYKNKAKGLLLGEAGVNAGTIINDKLQVPLMRGGMSSLQGLVTMTEILQAGYCLEYVVRVKDFDSFTAIDTPRELIKALR